jgi:hypothetical protein
MICENCGSRKTSKYHPGPTETTEAKAPVAFAYSQIVFLSASDQLHFPEKQ